MEFQILRAVPKDIDTLDQIMHIVKDTMERPEWFIADDRAYIQKHIGHDPVSAEDIGFTLKAVTTVDGKAVIAGFLIVAFPGIGEKNLGHHLQMSEQDLKCVAHMDSALVLPAYRGHKLQYYMIEEAERILQKETSYHIWMATIHPDNWYSLRNALAHGYRIEAKAMKYGGYPRYILKKEV